MRVWPKPSGSLEQVLVGDAVALAVVVEEAAVVDLVRLLDVAAIASDVGGSGLVLRPGATWELLVDLAEERADLEFLTATAIDEERLAQREEGLARFDEGRNLEAVRHRLHDQHIVTPAAKHQLVRVGVDEEQAIKGQMIVLDAELGAVHVLFAHAGMQRFQAGEFHRRRVRGFI